MTTCVDLRTYGDRYRVWNQPEGRKARPTDDPWDLILLGWSGFVAPDGGEHLLAGTRGPVTTRRILATVPDATVTQDGTDGQNVRFHVRHVEAVAGLLRLRRKRRMAADRAEAMAAYRFRAGHAPRSSAEGRQPH